MKRTRRLPVLPAAIVLGAVAVGAIVMAQTGKNQLPTASSVKNTAGGATEVALVQAAERRPLSFYTGGVRNDLFGAPVTIPPAKVTPTVTKPVVTETKTVEPVTIPDPLADYTYSGTVQMGDQMIAIVENSKTREGQFLKIGDSFKADGTPIGVVSKIDDRTVTISVAGSPKTLAKTDDYKLTPLDKNAPFLQANGQPGQPGPGGMMAPGMQVPGGPTGGQFPNFNALPPEVQQRIQQRMQNMTPEQRDRMSQFMNNRTFEGGRGGRRGYGGGGFGGGGFGGGGFGTTGDRGGDFGGGRRY